MVNSGTLLPLYGNFLAQEILRFKTVFLLLNKQQQK